MYIGGSTDEEMDGRGAGGLRLQQLKEAAQTAGWNGEM